MTPLEAKSWLIAQITAEAERTGSPLDPLEAGMLHYSETERTPPHYEALLAAFDQELDAQVYEARIAALVRNLHATWRDEGNPKLAQWRKAVESLKGQDHYLLTLTRAAGDSSLKHAKKRAGTSWTMIFIIAVIVTALVMWLLGRLTR